MSSDWGNVNYCELLSYYKDYTFNGDRCIKNVRKGFIFNKLYHNSKMTKIPSE